METRVDKKYDLEDRTAKFSDEIIEFSRGIKKDIINTPLISQLVRSATSIGANYCEANGASSKNDFRNKVFICKKEARETKYWLERIAKANPELKPEDIARKKEELIKSMNPDRKDLFVDYITF